MGIPKINKGRRMELTMLRYKKRLKLHGFPIGSLYCYKAQAVPCSCIFCSNEKFKRAVKHKNKLFI